MGACVCVRQVHYQIFFGTSQELTESLNTLAPKIQDFENNFLYIIREVHSEKPSSLSERVKSIVSQWHSLWEVLNRRKSLLLALFAEDFHAADSIVDSVSDSVSL